MRNYKVWFMKMRNYKVWLTKREGYLWIYELKEGG